MDEIINGSGLLNNINTLSNISALQSNTTISGGYVYINTIGFYFGNPALTGLSATSDNSIVVDNNGTRWIFQPQLSSFAGSINPTFESVTTGSLTNTGVTSAQFVGTSATGLIEAGTSNPTFTSVTTGSLTNTGTTSAQFLGTTPAGLIETGTLNPTFTSVTTGTTTATGLITAAAGLTVNSGQTLTNNGAYAGSPVLTGLTAGSGIIVANPSSPGPATITAVSSNYAFQGQQANVGTTSGTFVTTGTGVLLKPSASGNVKIILDAIWSNGTANSGITYNIAWGQGTSIPAAGSGVQTGMTLLLPTNITVSSGGGEYNLHLEYLLTGLSLETSYIFEPIFAVVAGGTANFAQIDMWVVEIN